MIHELKIQPGYFDLIRLGVKTFEVRKEEDRRFDEHDVLRLLEYRGTEYTGRVYDVLVLHCFRHPEYVLPGHVIMSIARIPQQPMEQVTASP